MTGCDLECLEEQCDALGSRTGRDFAVEHWTVLQSGVLALPCGEFSQENGDDGSQGGRSVHCFDEKFHDHLNSRFDRRRSGT